MGLGKTTRNVAIVGGVTLTGNALDNWLLSGEGKEYLASLAEDAAPGTFNFLEGAAEGLRDLGGTVAGGAAQVSGEGQFEGWMVLSENLGKLWNTVANFFYPGSQSGLSVVNAARREQDGQRELLRTPSGELVEVDAEAPADPANAEAPATTVAPDGTVITADNTNGAPNADITTQIETDFGIVERGRRSQQITYAETFKSAAENLGIELDGDLTLEQAVEIAIEANPSSKEEFGAIMTDYTARVSFEKSYNIAKEGGVFSSYSRNISGFFQEAHDGMVDNTNAPLTEMAANVTATLAHN